MAKAESKAAVKPKPPVRSEDELERMKKAYERQQTRHDPVVADVTREEDGRLALEVPHDDRRGWLIRLGDAMGTRSDKFALGQLAHLLAMIPEGDPSPDNNANSMLAAVDAVRPETEIEGMLAVQMAATHQLAMVALGRAAVTGNIQAIEVNSTLATKMLRTFTTQVEALAKLRRGGEQKVKVEHVHVYEGGQAIVGNVNGHSAHPRKGGGGRQENGHQPHEPIGPRAIAVALGDEMLREDAGRDPMPVAGGAGEGAVPQARRGGGKRRAQG